MKTAWVMTAAAFLGTSQLAQAGPAGSTLAAAPNDPKAVTVHGIGDGRADDTAAVQSALDAARDKTGHGIVFLPSGRYRISRTLLVPAGVRIFGVGKPPRLRCSRGCATAARRWRGRARATASPRSATVSPCRHWARWARSPR